MFARLQKSSFARFLALGGFCFAMNLAILAFLVEVWGVHYLVAMIVSIVVVNSTGFLLNRRFTFAAQAHDFWRELKRYFTVNLGAYALSLGAMAVLVDGLKIPYLWANAFLAIAFAAGNFLLHSRWSFAVQNDTQGDKP